MTILFYSNRPSNGLNNLRDAINEAHPGLAVKLKPAGSTRRINNSDMVVNWGCSQVDLPRLTNPSLMLNQAASVAIAANKLEAFRRFQSENIPTVAWTTERETAQAWLDSGDIVYSRTLLRGHSGEGIVLSFNNPAGVGDAGDAFVVSNTLPSAQLYTKAVMGQRREWRIHVMNGQVIHVQQKKRANGYENNPSYSNLVRNHHTGWIYATSEIQLPTGVDDIAIRTIAALGLDFGAVDIITRQGSTYVLEVNTACGQEAEQTLGAYVAALVAVHNNEAIPAPTPVQSVAEETAPAERSDNEIRSEGNEAHGSFCRYINETSHLSVDGGFHRTAFRSAADAFFTVFDSNRDEGSLRVLKNQLNKLKAAVQRFGEKAIIIEQRWNQLNVTQRSLFGAINYRGVLQLLVANTAAEVTERFQVANVSWNNHAIRANNTIAENDRRRAELIRQREADAQAAATAENTRQAVAAQAASADEDVALTLSNCFGDWVRDRIRDTGLSASQITAIVMRDYMVQ